MSHGGDGGYPGGFEGHCHVGHSEPVGSYAAFPCVFGLNNCNMYTSHCAIAQTAIPECVPNGISVSLDFRNYVSEIKASRTGTQGLARLRNLA